MIGIASVIVHYCSFFFSSYGILRLFVHFVRGMAWKIDMMIP